MKEYHWHLRRAAIVLFPSSALSLAFAALPFNKKGAILAGALIQILSLTTAMFLVRKNSRFSLWSMMVSGVMIMIATAISAIIFKHWLLWVLHVPGWGASTLYWLLLWECKDSLLLVSFTFFVSAEAVFLAIFLNKILVL